LNPIGAFGGYWSSCHPILSKQHYWAAEGSLDTIMSLLSPLNEELMKNNKEKAETFSLASRKAKRNQSLFSFLPHASSCSLA